MLLKECFDRIGEGRLDPPRIRVHTQTSELLVHRRFKEAALVSRDNNYFGVLLQRPDLTHNVKSGDILVQLPIKKRLGTRYGGRIGVNFARAGARASLMVSAHHIITTSLAAFLVALLQRFTNCYLAFAVGQCISHELAEHHASKRIVVDNEHVHDRKAPRGLRRTAHHLVTAELQMKWRLKAIDFICGPHDVEARGRLLREKVTQTFQCFNLSHTLDRDHGAMSSSRTPLLIILVCLAHHACGYLVRARCRDVRSRPAIYMGVRKPSLPDKFIPEGRRLRGGLPEAVFSKTNFATGGARDSNTVREIEMNWVAFKGCFANEALAVEAAKKNSAVFSPQFSSPTKIKGTYKLLCKRLGKQKTAALLMKNPGVLCNSPAGLAQCTDQEILNAAELVESLDANKPLLNALAGLVIVLVIAAGLYRGTQVNPNGSISGFDSSGAPVMGKKAPPVANPRVAAQSAPPALEQ